MRWSRLGSGFDMDLEFESGFDPENAKQTLASMLSSTNSELEGRMTRAGLNVEKGAKQRSRVDTGNMRAAWESETRSRGSTIISEVGNNSHYAVHHEYGTRSISPAPMLRPALDEESRDLIRDIRQLVSRVAEQEGNG